MNQDQEIRTESKEALSRRAIAKKAAYVAPAVLALIAAAERPALAQSLPNPQ